jgi:hypothetical protein
LIKPKCLFAGHGVFIAQDYPDVFHGIKMMGHKFAPISINLAKTFTKILNTNKFSISLLL